jgi:hypothetical protein
MPLLAQQRIAIDENARCSRAAPRWGVGVGHWTLPELELQLLLGRWAGRSTRHVELELWLWWLLDLGLGLCKLCAEDFLHPLVDARHEDAVTYLKLEGEVVQVAAVFVVDARVLPHEAHCLLKRTPALEKRLACGCVTADDTTHFLLYGGQRHGILDECIVVLQASRGQVEEWQEYLQVATAACQWLIAVLVKRPTYPGSV